MSDIRSPMHPAGPWLHLALLILIVSATQTAHLAMGTEHAFTFLLFARSMYDWLPALAGIAVSVAAPDERITRVGISLGVVVIFLMIALDYSGSLAVLTPESTALFPDASVAR